MMSKLSLSEKTKLAAEDLRELEAKNQKLPETALKFKYGNRAERRQIAKKIVPKYKKGKNNE